MSDEEEDSRGYTPSGWPPNVIIKKKVLKIAPEGTILDEHEVVVEGQELDEVWKIFQKVWCGGCGGEPSQDTE